MTFDTKVFRIINNTWIADFGGNKGKVKPLFKPQKSLHYC